MPDIYQDKPFRIGAIKVEPEKLSELEEKLRYFQFDGKPVRALRYNPDFLPQYREKLIESTIFIKHLPKDLSAKELHEKITSLLNDAQVKSLKISLDPQHNSREYGFVTF